MSLSRWFPSWLRRVGLSVPVMAMTLTLSPVPGHTQSFFQQLFGGAPKPVARPSPQYSPQFGTGPQRLSPVGNNGSPYRAPVISPNRPVRDDDDDGDGRGRSSKGTHRTVCVRMCDGYYWPVSYQTKKSHFFKDERACQSSCDGEAKLFHYPNPGGEIDQAVDSSGRTYGRLPVAFLYRKKLVAGCTCRPEAWSSSEVSRHNQYAMTEAAEKAEQAEEEARIAAAEAEKAEAAKLAADAKALGKPAPGRKARTVAAADTAAVADLPPTPKPIAAQDASSDAPAVEAAPATTASPVAKAKSRRARPDDGLVPRDAGRPIRHAQLAAVPRPKPATYQTSSGGGMFGGFGSSKHTWPGD
jgi:hypothetical protein